jgi:protein ImuA
MLAQDQLPCEVARQLAEHLLALEEGEASCQRVSSGVEALDRLLPGDGLGRGRLVEWLAEGRGSGAGTLAILAAREACREARGRGRLLVVVDRQGCFYPPAAAAWGVDVAQMIVLRPTNEHDEQWAVDQALRCRGVGAVLAWPGHIAPRTFRRWQLAARQGGVLGCLVRPATVSQRPGRDEKGDRSILCEAPSGPFRQNGPVPFFTAKKSTSKSLLKSPSWADVRLLVEARPGGDGRLLRVSILNCRGGRAGSAVDVRIDERGVIHETHPLPVVSALAYPAAAASEA